MSRFKGIYWRQFTVTAGMVALTLVLLGTSFFALAYSYLISEKRSELADEAEVIAQMAVSAYNKPGVLAGGLWSDDVREIVEVAKRMSETDFLIWIPSLGGFISTDESITSGRLTLPVTMGEKLANGEIYAGTSKLGIYEKPRFVVAIPARTVTDDIVVGPVLAVAEPNSMTEMWWAFLGNRAG